MERVRLLTVENIYFRHSVFWIGWIIGFTFIKSFGEGLSVYGAWLSYYLITLPVFVVHTYLVVYWAGKRFLKGWRIFIFILIFVILLCLFSIIELFITDKFLSVIFHYVFQITDDFYSISNILISGVGNLYIMLVFVAAKLVRLWFLSEDSRKDMVQRNLEIERADANSGIQPGMLLYIISELERMSDGMREEVPAVIAQLSDLLNEVMKSKKLKFHRVDEEMVLIRKMISLYGLLLDNPAPSVYIEGSDLSKQNIPVFMLFSPLEMFFRARRCIPASNIRIKLAELDSLEAVISWDIKDQFVIHDVSSVVFREVQELYGDRFRINYIATGTKLDVNVVYTNGEYL